MANLNRIKMTRKTRIKLVDNSLNIHWLNKEGKWLNEKDKVEVNLKKDYYKVLSFLSAKINAQLQDESFIKASVHFFGEGEYDQNTRDPFLTVVPKNEDGIELRTGNLIGFVSNDRYEIQISSRFGDNFLKTMIRYAEGFLELPD